MRHNILAILLVFVISNSYSNTLGVGKFIGSKTSSIPSWFLDSFLNITEDINDSKTNNKRLILFFHQDGCPYCNLFITKNLADIKIKQKIRKHFNILAINMWGDREVTYTDGKTYTEKQLAIKYKVQFTPTLIFLNESGSDVLRINGYINIAKLHKALDYIKNKQEHIVSYINYSDRSVEKKSHGKLNFEPDMFMEKPYILLRGSDSSPLAVWFESKNCPDCTYLHKSLLADPKTKSLLKTMDMVQLDIDSDTAVLTPQGKQMLAKDWAASLKIVFSPSIVFFDNKGKEIIRLETKFKKFHSQSIIDYVASGAYKKNPEFQRYLTNRADLIRESGKDVNIWQ